VDDFDAFFQDRLSYEGLSIFHIAQRWASVFGWENLNVRPLDRAALVGGDLITDFMSLCGLDEAEAQLASLKRLPRANESPGWKTTEAIRAYYGDRTGLAGDHPLTRTAVPKRRRDRQTFRAVAEEVGAEMGWSEERGLYMTRAQAARCVSTYASWVESLNEHLSVKLPHPLSLEERDFVERPFLPDASHIDPGELRQFYDTWGERWAAR